MDELVPKRDDPLVARPKLPAPAKKGRKAVTRAAVGFRAVPEGKPSPSPKVAAARDAARQRIRQKRDAKRRKVWDKLDAAKKVADDRMSRYDRFTPKGRGKRTR